MLNFRASQAVFCETLSDLKFFSTSHWNETNNFGSFSQKQENVSLIHGGLSAQQWYGRPIFKVLFWIRQKRTWSVTTHQRTLAIITTLNTWVLFLCLSHSLSHTFWCCKFPNSLFILKVKRYLFYLSALSTHAGTWKGSWVLSFFYIIASKKGQCAKAYSVMLVRTSAGQALG